MSRSLFFFSSSSFSFLYSDSAQRALFWRKNFYLICCTMIYSLFCASLIASTLYILFFSSLETSFLPFFLESQCIGAFLYIYSFWCSQRIYVYRKIRHLSWEHLQRKVTPLTLRALSTRFKQKSGGSTTPGRSKPRKALELRECKYRAFTV